MPRSISCLLATSVEVVLAFVFAINAIAATVVDSTGFNSYNNGALQGQSGWMAAGSGGSTATVTPDVGVQNSKGVVVNRAGGSDYRWAVPVTGQGYPHYRYILVDWDMKLTNLGAAGAFGPFLGVDTYNYTSGPMVLGTLGVDATTRDLLYQAGGSGVLTEAGMLINLNQWYHYQIRLDFTLDRYQILVDGTLRGTTGFVDGPSNAFTDADIATFAAGFDSQSQSQTGSAVFDNFLVREILPGDFNIDGNVNSSDLATWQAAYGVNANGDADYDGDTDGRDFVIWQRHFTESSSLASVSTIVPEPSAVWLATLAACCISGRNHRNVSYVRAV
jgi:hypothetical protein